MARPRKFRPEESSAPVEPVVATANQPFEVTFDFSEQQAEQDNSVTGGRVEVVAGKAKIGPAKYDPDANTLTATVLPGEFGTLTLRGIAHVFNSDHGMSQKQSIEVQAATE